MQVRSRCKACDALCRCKACDAKCTPGKRGRSGAGHPTCCVLHAHGLLGVVGQEGQGGEHIILEHLGIAGWDDLGEFGGYGNEWREERAGTHGHMQCASWGSHGRRARLMHTDGDRWGERGAHMRAGIAAASAAAQVHTARLQCIQSLRQHSQRQSAHKRMQVSTAHKLNHAAAMALPRPHALAPARCTWSAPAPAAPGSARLMRRLTAAWPGRGPRTALIVEGEETGAVCVCLCVCMCVPTASMQGVT